MGKILTGHPYYKANCNTGKNVSWLISMLEGYKCHTQVGKAFTYCYRPSDCKDCNLTFLHVHDPLWYGP